MRMQQWRLVGVLGTCLAASGCGNLASRADEGCQMAVRSPEGWSIAGARIPVTRPPSGTMVEIGSVTYGADQAYEISQSAEMLDQARLQTCATIYAPGFSTRPDAERESFYGRAIVGADQMNRFGRALNGATTVEAGLAAAQDARRAAAQIGAALPMKKPHAD